jgi:hypothetical protein
MGKDEMGSKLGPRGQNGKLQKRRTQGKCEIGIKGKLERLKWYTSVEIGLV